MNRDTVDYYRPPAADALGLIRLRANADGITEIDFVDEETEPVHPGPLTDQAREQLAEYFAGTRRDFDLPLAPMGTDFQRRVWTALAHIPYGETRNYAELAEQLGSKGGQRAVGAANGRNPISIVVPCHRVIGSDGRMTGYAGGIGRKRWLLAFEAGEVPMLLV
ncbi:MAG: methylated-DNA--[protein]-cysteine S-methyltransferase [Halomonas sp.]|uniref:methylated-DNA--[protein]-cysteine S-methyltransferase n=2 Tax=Halomonas TaxID=2745 RepID=UPI0017C01EB7|nr:methylated-DNA--[protein]-cysteine S-methyltransferase [Halomonas sp.]NWN82454.1 methylated-DNA--[protein]-cysteine S-methyltransferase [Halomonas sp.]